MELCENCGVKLEKPEECPYCKKRLCAKCYAPHMNWEKQHQDWNLYQTSPAMGLTSSFGSKDLKSYGPVYQTEQGRRRYRRSRRR